MRVPLLVLIAASVAGPASHAQTRSPQEATVRTIADSIPGGTGGLELGPDGHLYTADFGATLSRGPAGTKVFRVSMSGVVSVFATGLLGASGNTFADDGSFLQSNIAGNTIARISPDGNVRAFATAGLSNPVGIIKGSDGAYYVANCGANDVRRVTPEGVATLFSADPLLNCPNGIALGPNGQLYVSNFYNGDVVRLDHSGRGARLASLPGANNGHLVFGNGVFYVVARKANQIYEVAVDGTIRLLAGSGARGGLDGPAGSATFSLPNDLALSSDGRTLYVNEVSVNAPGDQVLAPTRIRAVTLSPR
jgi:sugar lactone lactonase YvrE